IRLYELPDGPVQGLTFYPGGGLYMTSATGTIGAVNYTYLDSYPEVLHYSTYYNVDHVPYFVPYYELANPLLPVSQSAQSAGLGAFVAPAGTNPSSMTVGSDAALWFMEPGINAIGRLDLHSTSPLDPPYTPPNNPPLTSGIISGADGNIWFSESNGIGELA